MGGISRSLAELRIWGDDLDPSEISRMLGSEPTFAARKGDVVRRKKGGKGRVARKGVWNLEARDCEPGDIDAQISEILGKLTGDLGTWSSIAKAYTCNLRFGLFMTEWNEWTFFSRESLAALGSRGIELTQEIYGPSELSLNNPVQETSAKAADPDL